MPGPPKIKAQNVYLDRKSIERNGRVKEKFKLAGYPSPLYGVGRLFWVLTSQNGVYPANRTIKVEIHHWENKHRLALNKPLTYVCPDKCEQLTTAQVRQKRTDLANGFRFSARLCDEKFDELAMMVKKLKLTEGLTIDKWRKIAASVSPPSKIDNILRELHLG